jgi:hypothetical protein
LNEALDGADIHIPKHDLTVPAENLIGQKIQIRVNPARPHENFVSRSSMSGLSSAATEWIMN